MSDESLLTSKYDLNVFLRTRDPAMRLVNAQANMANVFDKVTDSIRFNVFRTVKLKEGGQVMVARA